MAVRTAVIGAGTISQTHLSGISANPRTELVGVCDLDEEAAERRAREFSTAAFTDLAQLLDGSVDAIHVCTPAQTHFDIARQAIEADVAVLLEKPATVTAEEVDQLDQLARANDVPATVVHQHLFYPAVRRVRRSIARGELGEIRGYDVIYAGLTPPDTVNRGSWVFDLPGGEFEEGLPHPLYSALGLGGFPASVDGVDAQTTLTREYEDGFSYDQAQVQYVSEGGALCSVKMLSGTLPQRLHVIDGTEGSVVLDELNQSVVPIDEDYTASVVARSRKGLDVAVAQLSSTVENGRSVLATKLSGDWESQANANGHYAIFDRFAKAVEGGGDVPVPLEQSTWTIRLMEAIREAAERGTRSAEASIEVGP